VKKPGLVLVPPKGQPAGSVLAAGGNIETADLNRVRSSTRNQGDENASYYDLQKFLNFRRPDPAAGPDGGTAFILLSSKKSKYVKILGSGQTSPVLSHRGSGLRVRHALPCGDPRPDANIPKCASSASPGGPEADFLLDMQKFIDNGKTEDLPCFAEGDMRSSTAKTSPGQRPGDGPDIVPCSTAWFVISSLKKMQRTGQRARAELGAFADYDSRPSWSRAGLLCSP